MNGDEILDNVATAMADAVIKEAELKEIASRSKNLLWDVVRRFDTVCLENLNVEGMMKNHHLANSIQSAAWSEFVRQLTYKSEWHGGNVVFIGRFEPSSRTCSVCGHVNRGLTLRDREWTCPECGTRHDRDVNAAVNIRQMALEKQNLIGT